MTRSELVDRLSTIRDQLLPGGLTQVRVAELIADIEADGVLDVQAPAEIAEQMGLPRPA